MSQVLLLRALMRLNIFSPPPSPDFEVLEKDSVAEVSGTEPTELPTQ